MKRIPNILRLAPANNTTDVRATEYLGWKISICEESLNYRAITWYLKLIQSCMKMWTEIICLLSAIIALLFNEPTNWAVSFFSVPKRPKPNVLL